MRRAPRNPQRQLRSTRSTPRAFTLVEMLIVVAMIGALSAAAVFGMREIIKRDDASAGRDQGGSVIIGLVNTGAARADITAMQGLGDSIRVQAGVPFVVRHSSSATCILDPSLPDATGGSCSAFIDAVVPLPPVGMYQASDQQRFEQLLSDARLHDLVTGEWRADLSIQLASPGVVDPAPRRLPGSIYQGTVLLDETGSPVINPSASPPLLSRLDVFLDLNGNGLLDAGEAGGAETLTFMPNGMVNSSW